MIEEKHVQPGDKMEEILFAVGRAQNQQLPFDQWKQDIIKEVQQKKSRRVHMTRMLASAAALVLLLGGAGVASRFGMRSSGGDTAIRERTLEPQQYNLVLQNVNTYDEVGTVVPSGSRSQLEGTAVTLRDTAEVDYMLYLPCS